MDIWQPIPTAPRDGSLLDVWFDIASAEAGAAEFYAPGCTQPDGQNEPVIEQVACVNGHFRPVIDQAGTRAVIALAGGWGTVEGVAHGIVSVTLTRWRPAAGRLRD